MFRIRKLADEGIIDQVIGVAASGSSSPTDNPKRRYVRWDAELSIENPAKFSKTMPVRKDTKWFAKARSGAIRTMRNPNLPASLPHNFHIAALNRQGTIVEQVAYVDPRTVHYETFDDDNGINGGGTMQFEQIKFVFWLRPHDDIAEIRFLQGNLNSATTPRLIASVKVR